MSWLKDWRKWRDKRKKERPARPPRGTWKTSQVVAWVVGFILLVGLIAALVLSNVRCGDETVSSPSVSSEPTTATTVVVTTTTLPASSGEDTETPQSPGANEDVMYSPVPGSLIFTYHDVLVVGSEAQWYQRCLQERLQLSWQWVISLDGYESAAGDWPYPFLGVLASNTTMSPEEIRAWAAEKLRTWGYEGDIPDDLPILPLNGFLNTRLYPDRGTWKVFQDDSRDVVELVLLVPLDINNPLGGFYLDRAILLTCGNPITIEKWTTTTVPRTTSTTIPRTTSTTSTTSTSTTSTTLKEKGDDVPPPPPPGA